MWTKIRNLDEILNKIGGFGWTKMDILTARLFSPYN